jgi:hypothetical protein
VLLIPIRCLVCGLLPRLLFTVTAFTSCLELAENSPRTSWELPEDYWLRTPENCSEIESQIYVTSDGQSASLSWFQAPIWGWRPYFCCWLTCAGFFDVGRSLWRENGSAIYNSCWSSPAQSLLVPNPKDLVTIFFCLRFETPPTWRASFPYLYPPGAVWPSYTPRHWVITRVALYSLRANRTENSASNVETCLPNHCIETVAALTAANSSLRALPSNDQ